MENLETTEEGLSYGPESSALSIALILAVVLLLMVSTFVWFVVEFDPLTDDFVEQPEPVVTVVSPLTEN